MGRVNNKNIISGSVANLVFRNLDGKQIVQTHPGKVKQTRATKASGSEFRHCSSWAKMLRNGLYPFLIDQTDSYMYRRLTGQLYDTLLSNTYLPKGERTPLNADMQNLEGFEFNTHSLFKDYFQADITVTLDAQRQLQITVPELEPKTQIVFPPQTDTAELLVYIYATNLEDDTQSVDAFFSLPLEKNIPLNQPTVWTSPALPDGFFIIATAKLLFYSANRLTTRNDWNSKTLNPAMVVFCKGRKN